MYLAIFVLIIRLIEKYPKVFNALVILWIAMFVIGLIRAAFGI